MILKKHTITLEHEYVRRLRHIPTDGVEIFNIDMISDCILEYSINYYINNSVKLKSDEYDYNKRYYESNDTKIFSHTADYPTGWRDPT